VADQVWNNFWLGWDISMRNLLLALPLIGLALIAAKPAPPPPPVVTLAAPAAVAADPANRLNLELSSGGTVVVQLRPDVAPNHVYRIQTLASQGFYNGLTFHRVIPGFMAQGGDPKGNGSGGSNLPNVPAEFSDLPHMRGVMAMARTQEDVNGGNSQFFIMLSAGTALDHQYSIFGRVISGMQYVDAIAPGEPPENPTKIIRAWIDGPLPAPPAAAVAATAATASPAPEAKPAGN
jgi:cyclophilin family peptidyl-prolyl cis-trans isomerase